MLVNAVVVPLGGGDTGLKVCGNGNAGIDIDEGDGGGEGVDDVDRNVGPRGVVTVDAGESSIRPGTVRSSG
jgi:Ethanolamine utilization protein EutJ (predicted chaperonin)